jgi:hypothetical protein
MSPLEIKAVRDFGIKVSTEGAGETPEANPITIVKENGEVVGLDLRVFFDGRRFIPVKAGEAIVLPDVKGNLTVTTHSGLAISKEAAFSAAPQNDQVTLTIRLEGTGFGEEPVNEIVMSRQAWGFKKPVPVEINRQTVAEVSWSEE